MVDWGGNYPPGAKNDPRAPYNQPDRSHEHRWRPVNMDTPVMEDGAAIFHEKCTYTEGRRGDGWQCDEERNYRFEYSTLVTRANVEYDVPPIGEWENLPSQIAELVIRVEEAFQIHGPGDKVSWDVDPDPDVGHVAIEWNGYTLRYEP